MWMCSLCRLPVAKNHNFWQILTFGGACTGPLLLTRVQFVVLEQSKGLHLHTKFHLNVFIAWASGCQKPQFWAIFNFWGLLYRPSFTDESQIWGAIADPQCKFTCQNSSRSVYSVDLWRFLPFFGLWHLMMSTVGGNLRKLNTRAQLQTFPYPMVSKSFLYSNDFMAKSGAQTLTFKSVMDRQKTQRFSSLQWRVTSEPHQTWHGDIGAPWARSCISKTFGGLTHSFAARSTASLGVTLSN